MPDAFDCLLYAYYYAGIIGRGLPKAKSSIFSNETVDDVSTVV